MTVIDAHQHVWDPRPGGYAWLANQPAAIARPIGFEELQPALARAGIDATVMVQSDDTAEDTDRMLAVAATHPQIAAVVAHVPLQRPREAAERLVELRQNKLVVGFRTLIHDLPDPDWILSREADAGLSVLEDADVTFDYVSVQPRHLENLTEVARRHPGLRIVIDHLAKPPIGAHEREPWWSLIARAAEHPLVYAKVSGLYAVTAAYDWSPDSLRPFFARALDLFGADRLMYGGDWPVSLIAGGYDSVWAGLSSLFDGLDDTQRDAVLGGTAESFYRIDPGLLERATAASEAARAALAQLTD